MRLDPGLNADKTSERVKHLRSIHEAGGDFAKNESRLQ